MEGYNMQLAAPFAEEASKKASVGDFDAAEGLLLTVAAIYHGGNYDTTESDPPYIREAAKRVVYNRGARFRPGKSVISPRDPSVHWYVSSAALGVDAAKAKWEEGAPARAAEARNARLRKVAEEIARLKAELARVEQEEVDRQAALAKEALEKLRIQKEEEEEKQRKAEVTSLERDAAALREKLASSGRPTASLSALVSMSATSSPRATAAQTTLTTTM
jgi:hypothetical protein